MIANTVTTVKANPLDSVYEEAREVFVGMQKSPNTQRAYRNDIRKWEQFVLYEFKWSDHFILGQSHALAFKQALVDNYAPSTAQRVWCTVAAFYGWMKGLGHATYSPFDGVKAPTRPTDEPPPVPTDSEIAAFFQACEKEGGQYGWRAYAVGAFLLNGLRAQEVCDALSKDFVWDDANECWVLTVLGKGDKYRRVPINSEAQQALFDYWLEAPKSEYLICNNTGGQLNVRMVHRLISFFGKKAGIEGLHPHAFRHHYATRLVRGGVDLFTLQKLLGHKNTDTTQRYVALDNKDLAKALEVDDRHLRALEIDFLPDHDRGDQDIFRHRGDDMWP